MPHLQASTGWTVNRFGTQNGGEAGKISWLIISHLIVTCSAADLTIYLCIILSFVLIFSLFYSHHITTKETLPRLYASIIEDKKKPCFHGLHSSTDLVTYTKTWWTDSILPFLSRALPSASLLSTPEPSHPQPQIPIIQGNIIMPCAQSLNHVQLFAIPWTVVCQLHCPWNFPSKNTEAGCHFLLQGCLPSY